MDDLVDETVNHRELPGEGEFDLRGYVAACQDHGYAGPWGVEVLSEELRNNPIDVIFRRAYETTAAQFGHGEELRVSAPRGFPSSTATGSSGCTSRCCGSASSRSGSSAPSWSTRA